ncbi:MAG: hypothetical protein KC492_42875 [Myxococcales bacterium]|nr:hypothetical protein [Myxococcales bacterium]
MRRLIALTITLICLALPTGIAYGSCNSTNALDRELDREALATYGASVANPSECRQTADSALVSTASTRTYDPSTGRFTAADPLETRNELDLEDPYVSAYVYVNNRATSMVDPSGEFPQFTQESAYVALNFVDLVTHVWVGIEG